MVYVAKEYQNCFHKTKQKLEENPAERQFDFSEMYIFGKFETFHRRLLKIMHVFDTITTYSVLQDSKMEGLEVMATKYQVCSICCFFPPILLGSSKTQFLWPPDILESIISFGTTGHNNGGDGIYNISSAKYLNDCLGRVL